MRGVAMTARTSADPRGGADAGAAVLSREERGGGRSAEKHGDRDRRAPLRHESVTCDEECRGKIPTARRQEDGDHRGIRGETQQADGFQRRRTQPRYSTTARPSVDSADNAGVSSPAADRTRAEQQRDHRTRRRQDPDRHAVTCRAGSGICGHEIVALMSRPLV
jgi:hypothetical protein